MSNIELAKSMIDKLPEDKIIFIINILENIGELSGLDIYPEYDPNQDTLEAIEEVNNMIKNNTGEAFDGSTPDFFARLGE
jgi:hypothetical protein